jgi:ABC-2 type transport system ATP-binding protein
MSNIIEVSNLTKKYGNFTAVDGISFAVAEGETFGILGPNGAGKTTTLEMIEGLKTITSGKVTLAGHDVETETDAVKSLIGVQLQATSFFDGLNLLELIDTFAAIYGREVDAMQILAEVELTEKATNRVKELSGGQKQRLSIAIALVNDPKVLFLDEPTTGLDPQARRHLWDLITKIKKNGKTIMLTTHYMDEAEVLCDRIAVMDHAKIVTLDTTRNLLTNTDVNPTIEFQTNKTISEDKLRALPGAISSSVENATHYVATSSPQATLDALFTLARNEQFAIEQLLLHRATLEDVFLKLTGHGLRD